VRLVVDVPEPALAPLESDASQRRLGIEDYGEWTPPGAPDLPMRTLLVAVPPSGDVHVSGFTSGARDFAGVQLAPTPDLAREEGDPARYRRTAAAYAAPSTAPAVELLGVSWMRDQRVAAIAVRPAAFDPRTRRLQVATRVEIEVQLDAAAASASTRPVEVLDPFEAVYRASLINYEQGRRWRRGPREGAVPGALGAPREPATLAIPDSSLFAGRAWVKIAIPKTGFYKLEFGQLRNLSAFGGASSVRLDSLRLFAWPGYPVLPESTFCDSCGYREVALQFSEDGDGLLNANSDELYFFALGPSDWVDYFDPALGDTTFLNHPYALLNYYYLTVATDAEPVGGTPARFGPVSAAPVVDGTEITPATFTMREHFEQDVEPFTNLSPFYQASIQSMFWEKFFWKSLTVGRGFPMTVDAPGIDVSTPANVSVLLWGVTSDIDTCYASSAATHQAEFFANGVSQGVEGWYGDKMPYRAVRDLTLAPSNTIEIRVPTVPECPGRVDQIAVAWLNVRYTRRFEPVSNELTFDSPPGGGNYIYRIAPFTSSTPPRVFDVTDPFAWRELTDLLWEDLGGSWRLSFETTESGVHHYRIIQSSSITKVATVDAVDANLASRENLRSATEGADYLVIYYDDFKSAADALKSWRSTHLPLDGAPGPYETKALSVSAVFDQFSGGRVDPGAIRSLLRSAFFTWRKTPAFVTLLGDASYDFKNVLGRAAPGQPGALVPSYENGFAINAMFATDDWLMNVDGSPSVIPDYYAGRIPATDAAQALDIVQHKVIANEQTAPFGAQRNRFLLIADDDTQGDKDDALHWTHLRQTADLDTSRVPDHFDRSYVYLHKYSYGPGFTKPDAKAAIRSSINNGITMFNYFGHGSPFKLADESVLLDTDAGTLDNADRLSLFFAASCDVGKFDDPQVPSMGERMILAPNGGAIAVISATELAYSSFNESLARNFFLSLFTRSSGSGQYYASVAQALLEAKLGSIGGVQVNNQKYQVLGDAATSLNLPKRWVDVTLHACDTCTAVLSEMKRGQTVTFRGRVLDAPGGAPAALDGVADVLIEDSAPLEQAPPCRKATCDSASRPLYYYRAGPIFRGDVRVVGGSFSGQFFVPVEAKTGAKARARAYVSGRVSGETADGDGVGSIRAQLSPGSPPPGDNQGPTITLSFTGGSTSVRSDAMLQVDLFDQSGILTTGHSPQNGIIVTIDDNTTARKDITDSFRYLQGSFQSGTASYQLENLAPGNHTIRVSAADNLAAGLSAATHRSEATLAFQVADLPPLSIAFSYLFPNPTHSRGAGAGGQFVVDARGDSLNSLLRIYTVAGKLVRTLRLMGGIGQVQLAWDGLDDEGQPLANGTYLFRVQINAREENGKSSARQKAAAEGRFVILNP
jgi:hypothetical protein